MVLFLHQKIEKYAMMESDPELKVLSNAFKALSNPNRLKIYLEILTHNSRQMETGSKECGCALTDFISCLNVGAPTVSHHIKELVNAGLITAEKQGKFMTCYLNNEMRERLSIFLKGNTHE